MAVEYWTQEDLEEYYDNPNIFIQRANQMRSQMICEFLAKLKKQVMSLFR